MRKTIDQRRPSLPISVKPYGLWSLWDMLNEWGYRFLGIGIALAHIEADLETHRRSTNGSSIGHGTSTIDPDHPTTTFIVAKCDEILKLIDETKYDLGAIPGNLQRVKALIAMAKQHKVRGPALYTNDLLDDIRRVQNDFRYILSGRFFYSITPELQKFYGNPDLFGECVAKKFPKAAGDIEHAGNCLALGEPTACVLHLNRAMEIATRRLARKLRATLDAKDSWGMVLGKMNDPIRAMKDNTPAQKRKKEKWAECRTNLYHVKMAWRDPGSHGTVSYSDKEARDIVKRVEDFLQQLATLL